MTKDHFKVCPLKVVSCTNRNCHVTLTRNKLQSHVTTTCDWRILRCKHCRLPSPACKTKVNFIVFCFIGNSMPHLLNNAIVTDFNVSQWWPISFQPFCIISTAVCWLCLFPRMTPKSVDKKNANKQQKSILFNSVCDFATHWFDCTHHCHISASALICNDLIIYFFAFVASIFCCVTNPMVIVIDNHAPILFEPMMVNDKSRAFYENRTREIRIAKWKFLVA